MSQQQWSGFSSQSIPGKSKPVPIQIRCASEAEHHLRTGTTPPCSKTTVQNQHIGEQNHTQQYSLSTEQVQFCAHACPLQQNPSCVVRPTVDKCMHISTNNLGALLRTEHPMDFRMTMPAQVYFYRLLRPSTVHQCIACFFSNQGYAELFFSRVYAWKHLLSAQTVCCPGHRSH